MSLHSSEDFLKVGNIRWLNKYRQTYSISKVTRRIIKYQSHHQFCSYFIPTLHKASETPLITVAKWCNIISSRWNWIFLGNRKHYLIPPKLSSQAQSFLLLYSHTYTWSGLTLATTLCMCFHVYVYAFAVFATICSSPIQRRLTSNQTHTVTHPPLQVSHTIEWNAAILITGIMARAALASHRIATSIDSSSPNRQQHHQCLAVCVVSAVCSLHPFSSVPFNLQTTSTF